MSEIITEERPRGLWQSTKLIGATVADTTVGVTVQGGEMAINTFGMGANIAKAGEIVSRNLIRAADLSEVIFEIETEALKLRRLKELQEEFPDLARWTED